LSSFVSLQSQDRIGTLAVLSDLERERVIVSFNDTDCEIASTTLPDLFSEQVVKSPEAPALIFEDIELSYGSLIAARTSLRVI